VQTKHTEVKVLDKRRYNDISKMDETTVDGLNSTLMKNNGNNSTMIGSFKQKTLIAKQLEELDSTFEYALMVR
jgi:phosphodiesterase/alkaline phosphatase D-like protein